MMYPTSSHPQHLETHNQKRAIATLPQTSRFHAIQRWNLLFEKNSECKESRRRKWFHVVLSLFQSPKLNRNQIGCWTKRMDVKLAVANQERLFS